MRAMRSNGYVYKQSVLYIWVWLSHSRLLTTFLVTGAYLSPSPALNDICTANEMLIAHVFKLQTYKVEMIFYLEIHLSLLNRYWLLWSIYVSSRMHHQIKHNRYDFWKKDCFSTFQRYEIENSYSCYTKKYMYYNIEST